MKIASKKKLSVRLHGKEIGILEEIQGKMRFQYNSKAERPLSLSLPIKEGGFTHKQCNPYFGGLLPENQEIRKALGVRYKINHNNDFALLSAIGHDCAGAVSFHSLDTPELEQVFQPLKAEPLSEEQIVKLIEELPVKPYMGRRLSLAGAQEKTPISVIDGKITFPSEESPTTHILKPALSHFKGSVANEYICLKTASAVGLNVPEVKIGKALSIEYFLIKRFDRNIINREIMRLHHEDFAQALAVPSDKKYEITFKDCLKVLKQLQRPALEKMKFVSLAIFNYLIGNCDAHGKNYSILYLDNGPVLAPVYDVLCTNVYDLDHKMAMKFGKTSYIQKVTLNDWKKFSEALEISFEVTIEELERQVNVIPDELANLVNQIESEIGNDIFKFVQKNCENTKKRLKL